MAQYAKSLGFAEQSSAPTNPTAGNRKVYMKTDGKMYQKDSAGTEIEIGSGGSGGTAADITYNNATSGLSANNVQAAIDEISTEKANKVQEAWIAPTLLSNWVNSGGDDAPCGYYKDEFDIVHLKGTIKSGTTNSNLFTLPYGYRPEKNVNFPAINNSTIGNITVFLNGNVKLQLGSNAWLSLDGITFKAGA